MNKTKYLYNHKSPETAYLVEDYPWGFRLRTKIRYWIESKDAKNGGQRFGSQTVNPKTGAWCSPKYSTYSPLMVMYLDENHHVKASALNGYRSEEDILKFKDTHLENLDEFQKERLREIIGYNQAMKKVTFTIQERASLSEEERIKEEEQQKQIKQKINKYINFKIKTTVL